MNQDLLGPSNKLLEVDLEPRTWTVSRIDPEDRRKFLGGKDWASNCCMTASSPGSIPWPFWAPTWASSIGNNSMD